MSDLADRIMRLVLREFYGDVDPEDWCNNWMVQNAEDVAHKVVRLVEEDRATRSSQDPQ